MTTAYTSLLGLALPVTGELSGTWGDVVNNSITSLLDSAIAGTTNVSTDGDVTLTTTTGAANTAREAILLFSGARTALRTVTAPAQSKVYTVINATTGGYSVKLVGSGPTTGVTIVAGESAVCAWNGSDFVKVSNTSGAGVFTSLTDTGLTSGRVTYATTGGLLTDDADLTFDGTTLSTAGLTASGTVTLSGGTANGVTYLNGSKVLTSGSALTFDGTNLSFVGTGTRGISITTNTSGNPIINMTAAGANAGYLQYSRSSQAIQLSADGTNNFYSVDYTGLHQWFTSGASELMRLTSTGLGIGTSSPSYKLDVSGTFRTTGTAYLGDATTTLIASIGNSGSSGVKIVQFQRATGTGDNVNIQGINTGVGAADIGMQVSGGNVGIGTSSPSSKLTVASSGSTIELKQNATGAATYYVMDNTIETGGKRWRFGYSGAAGIPCFSLYNQTDNVLSLVADASGNLGLGVTPSAGGATANYRLFEIGLDGGGSIYSGQVQTLLGTNIAWVGGTANYKRTGSPAMLYSQESGTHIWKYAGAGTAGNAISFTQAMTLDASGNLLVGGTSNAALDGVFGAVIGGSSKAGSGVAIETSTSQWLTYTDSTQALRFYDARQNVERAQIDSSGNLAIGTTTANSILTVGSNDNTAVITAGGANTHLTLKAMGSQGAVIFGAGGVSNGTPGTERARIDSSGSLLVGTTGSIGGVTGASVQVLNNGSSGIIVKQLSGPSDPISVWNSATSGDNMFVQFYTETAVTARGSITYNRGAGLVAYNVTSDYRAKDILGPVTNSGALIDSVPVYMGKMKGATQERPMFIAHETPSYAHTGEKDAVDEDGNPKYQQMDASALIPVMWAEIQSLRKRLADAGIA